MLAGDGPSLLALPQPRLGNVGEEWTERTHVGREQEESYKMPISGHAKVTVRINSRSRWLPAQDETCHNSSINGGHPWQGNYYHEWLLREGESFSFGDMVVGRFLTPQWMVPNLYTYEQQ